VCEAIQYQGQPCHTLESLWDALHGTYNAASRWQVDLSILDDLDSLPKRDWVGFSSHEMFDVLSACLSCSAPGPDHVTWTHLKRILLDSIVSGKILSLADVFLQVGYWLSHFFFLFFFIIKNLYPGARLQSGAKYKCKSTN
jgi:hypothetical protein